jgi:hypothetical protein
VPLKRFGTTARVVARLGEDAGRMLLSILRPALAVRVKLHIDGRPEGRRENGREMEPYKAMRWSKRA